MSSKVKYVSRFKDPGVDAQMREVVNAANELFGGLDTHAGRTDNPHHVTAAQVGAATPEYVDAKIATIGTGQMGDYVWKKNIVTGNLELYKASMKLMIIEPLGTVRLRGQIIPEGFYSGYTLSIPGVSYFANK